MHPRHRLWLRREAGDFFCRVPVGADTYVLQRILHDWPDEQALEILQRVREAMIPREKVPQFHEDEKAIDALAELSAGDVNRGLVVHDGRLAGFLSITDLARALEVGRPSRPVTARMPRRAP